VAILAKSADGTNRAPIELNGRTNAVDTRSEDHGTLVVEVEIVLGGVVGKVEVVGESRELGSDSVDLLDERHNVELESSATNVVLVARPEDGELLVGESLLLGLAEEGRGDVVDGVGRHLVSEVAETLELGEEPLVDLGQLPDLVDGVATVHGVGNGEHALVRGSLELGVQVDRHESLSLVETKVAWVDGTNGLLDSLLEGAANSHDLTNTLHGRAKKSRDTSELLQIPSRNLDNTVVERGLEAGACRLGHRVLDLVKRNVQTKLSSDKGQGITSGLGGESRGSGETGVDLDDAVLAALGVEGVLDVALSDNAKMSDDPDGSCAEHVVVLVGESLRGSNDDGVTSVNTKRVEVLHVTNGNAVVLAITNNFVLDLLPALHTALNKNLRAGGEGLIAEVDVLFHVLGETTAESSKRVGGTDNDGETDLLDGAHGLVEVVGGLGLGARGTNGVHAPCEELTVLGGDDGVDGGTEDLDAKLLKLVLELDTDRECGLSTESAVDGIRTLLDDDLADEFGVDGQEVDLVGETLGSLDSRNVGVDQDGVNALLFQSLDGLATRVVELSSLANAETTTSKNQDLLDVDLGHERCVLSGVTARELDGLLHLAGVLDHIGDCGDERVEEELGVARAGCALGVELNTEVRAVGVSDTLVTVVIGVDEELVPALRQSLGVDGITVVLRGDVALSGEHVGARNVVSAVTKLHLEGFGAGSASEQLVSKTDTKDGCPCLLQSCLNVLDSVLHHCWVTRSVGQEETVVLLACELGEIVVPGHNLDFDTALDEAAQLVELETDINTENTHGST
jgi:hypothetical protein